MKNQDLNRKVFKEISFTAPMEEIDKELHEIFSAQVNIAPTKTPAPFSLGRVIRRHALAPTMALLAIAAVTYLALRPEKTPSGGEIIPYAAQRPLPTTQSAAPRGKQLLKAPLYLSLEGDAWRQREMRELLDKILSAVITERRDEPNAALEVEILPTNPNSPEKVTMLVRVINTEYAVLWPREHKQVRYTDTPANVAARLSHDLLDAMKQ